jgi:hypothetical protein
MTFIPARSSLAAMRSPPLHWLAMLTLPLAAAGAHANEATPLSQAQAWEGLKARLSIGTAAPARSDPSAGDTEPHKINTLSLMGDYYLSRTSLGKSGGWRATSGVLLGARSSVWSSPSLLDRRIAGDGGDAGTQPYLGLGYTGWSSKGSWGLSADVGLMGLSRSTTRFGKSAPSSSLDDTVRDLRFAPLLQLGVSYSF